MDVFPIKSGVPFRGPYNPVCVALAVCIAGADFDINPCSFAFFVRFDGKSFRRIYRPL